MSNNNDDNDDIDWKEHVEFLIDNRDDYSVLKKYLDELHDQIEGDRFYDKSRHHDDDQLVQDIERLVEEWLSSHHHPYNDPEHNKKWKENLVDFIQYKRDSKYSVVDGKREYMGPYIGYDAFYKLTGDLYCYVLRKYYGLIGCTWYNG